MRGLVLAGLAVLSASSTGTAAIAQDSSGSSADALAKQLSNPISSLTSVPFQFNVDFGAGPDDDGVQTTLNIQPVVPFKLNDDWNVISRTIVPVIYSHDIFPEDVFGLSDTTESLFFSPQNSGIEGLTWGVGPIFLIPTATDPLIGTGKWGVGPTGVVFYQKEQLSMGLLASQLWSVAGDPDQPDVNQLYLQPFVAYSLGEGQTITADLEATHYWDTGEWSVPMNLQYSKVFKAGEQDMSFLVGARKYLVTVPDGPDWGLRSTLTFLFPEGK